MYVLVNSGEKWTPNKRRKKTMSKRNYGVEEQYHDMYMRWAGRTYKGKHPSHLVQGATYVFPPKPSTFPEKSDQKHPESRFFSCI